MAVVASFGLLASSLPAASPQARPRPAAAPGGVAIPPRMAFHSDGFVNTRPTDTTSIHTVHLDGSTRAPVDLSLPGGTGRRKRTPSWSPDGRRYAYVADTGTDGPEFTGQGTIFIADGDGTNKNITAPIDPPPAQFDSHRDPAWSPDGQYLAFVDAELGDEFGTIVVYNLATKQRATVPCAAPCRDRQPAWDPNGILPGDTNKPMRLAFSRVTRVGESGLPTDALIFTVDVNPPAQPNGPAQVAEPTQVTSHVEFIARDSHPAWSPDGRLITYALTILVTDGEGEFERDESAIFTIEPNGANNTMRIASSPSLVFIEEPVFTPDGGGLVFSAALNRASLRDLYTMRLTDKTARPFFTGPNNDSAPDFQPVTDLTAKWDRDSTRLDAGDDTRLTLTVKNNSDFPAPNATAQLTVPAGLTVRGIEPAGTCVVATRRCSFGTMGRGATATVTLDVTATAGGSHQVSAALDSGRLDLDAADNTATTTVIVDTPDIMVAVNAAPAETLIGFEPLVVTYTIRNAGTGRSGPVRFRATLPASLGIVSVRVTDTHEDPDSGTSCPNPTAGCDLGEFHNERIVGIEVTLSPDAAVISTAEGDVTAPEPAGNPANNHATTPIAVHSADIAVTAEANPAQTLVNRQNLVVKYTVRNNGTGSTGPVQFKATLPVVLPIVGTPVVRTTGGPPATCPDPVAGCDLGAFSPTRVVTVEVTLRPAVPFIGEAAGDVTAPRSTGSKDDNHAAVAIRVDTADLLITVTAVPPRTLVGHAPIVVTYTVRNAGTGTTDPVDFKATLPTNVLPITGPVVVTSTTDPANPPPCPDPVTGCRLGNFAPNRVVTITVTLRPDAPFIGEVVGEITEDTVIIEAVPRAAPAPNALANNIARTPIRVDTADVSVAVVAVPPKTFVGGDPILVRYLVTNAGTGASGPVRFTATLPTNVLPIRPPVVVSNTAGAPITCPNPTQGCNLGPLTPGQVVTIEVTLRPDAVFAGDVVGALTAPESTGSVEDNTSRTRIEVVNADIAVAVTAAPNPAYVGGDPIVVTYTVSNPGGGTTAPVRFAAALPQPLLPPLTVTVTDKPAPGTPAGQPAPACATPTSGCDLGPFPVGREVVIQVTLKAGAAVTGEAVGAVEMSFESPNLDANNTARAPVVVLAPTIIVTPDAGKPGYVPSIVGRNFPPGAKVNLKWDRGITAWPEPVTVGADGTFRAPMIILHKDMLGMRTMVATHAANLPGAGPKFGPTTAPCVVVAGSGQPDEWKYRR